MLKKILFFIVLSHLFGVINIASSEIIPLKKPVQTTQETEKKLLIDVLKPLKKPIKKTETKITQKEIIVKKEKKSGLILPKKKPIIAGSKKRKDVKISKYYSKKDFGIAKRAISEMKKSKWSTSLEIAKKAKDKSIYNVKIN